MRLIYQATKKPVALGDAIVLQREGETARHYTVGYFREPHKPASEGKVTLYLGGNPRASQEYYVSVIGAKWVDREDR